MSAPTDRLIQRLAEDGAPVRRLRPPMVRALAWLMAIGVVAAALVLTHSDLTMFKTRASDPRLALELAATLATGIAGVIAAFHLSLPDRARAWALLPAPFALLWLGLSGWGCYAHWAEQTAAGWALGPSSQCFVFILATGAPLGALLAWRLRRASPLRPRLTATVGAVGVAGLAAFLLQFFHPFDVTLLDLGAHLAAVVVILVVMAGAGRTAVGGA